MSRLTKSAQGEPCTLRLDGCYGGRDNETTVLAHLNGAGMGIKALDIHGAYCCANCHDILDRRKNTNYEKDWLEHQHLRAVIKTQERMIEKGVL